MHRTFSYISRAVRSLKSSPVPQPPKLTLRVADNEQGHSNWQENEEKTTESRVSDYILKGTLAGIVLMVGQKVDDTLASMFSWGSGMKV
jgi:hypothetical protein